MVCGKEFTTVFSFSNNTFEALSLRIYTCTRFHPLPQDLKYLQENIVGKGDHNGKKLTLYHTMPTFNDPDKEG